jgi:hypothetical protein
LLASLLVHPRWFAQRINLAWTYSLQGQWVEAEELQVQVLEAMKRVFGAEHPDTLGNMNNLAFTWKCQGRDTEALKLIEECVQRRSRILGSNHPDTNSSSAALSQWKSSRPSPSTEIELAEVETSLKDVHL